MVRPQSRLPRGEAFLGERTSAAPIARLSVVIVAWNCRDYVAGCLESIRRCATEERLEVIVVDNGSSDGTTEFVEKTYPWCLVIANTTNIGFPRANNIGIRHARGEFILLLNPDTILHAGTIAQCVAAMERDSSIGLLGCRILYPDGSLQYECAYHLPELRDVFIEMFYLHMLFPHSKVFGRHRMSYWDHLDDRQVPRISGAFMFIRREVLNHIGLLDERFFMYYEDVEFCARVAQAGWKIQYLGGPTIVHFGGKARVQSTVEFDYLAPVLRYTYFREYRGEVAAWCYRGLSLVQSLVRVVVALAGRASLFWRRGLVERPAFRPRIHYERLLWAVGRRSFVEIASPGADAASARRYEA